MQRKCSVCKEEDKQLQRSLDVSSSAELIQRREVCDAGGVCWSEAGADESYYQEGSNASYQSEEPNASYSEEPNASYQSEEPNASYSEEPNASHQQSETSADTEQDPLTEQQALGRMRQDIALAEQLLEDPNLSEEEKASLRRAIRDARSAVENYQDIRTQGSTRTNAMGGIGLAAAVIVADDATGVGVADDPLLILLAIAAIATLIATRPPSSQDAVAEAWLNIGRNLRGLADTIETVVLMTAAGNVIHEHIVNEAKELAIALGLAATAGEVTREVLCQMLERMARQYRRSDTDKWKKIIATQKGLGCRGSRASR